MAFHLTQRQGQQAQLMASDATHIMGYGGSRCLSGDAVLDGHTRTIAELAAAGEPVCVLTSHGWQMAEAPFRKGSAPLVVIETSDGRSVTVTSDHRFWSGCTWVRAEDLSIGSFVAVRSSEQILPASISGICPSASPADGPHSTGTTRGSRSRYSTGRRRGGARPQSVEVHVQDGRASERGASGHSLEDRRAGRSGSDTHAGHLDLLERAHSRAYRSSPRLSSLDGASDLHRVSQSGGHAFARISAPSRAQRSAPLQSAAQSPRPQPSPQGERSSSVQSDQAYDTPDASGYGLATVTRITQATEQNYYTLHVPGCEHYFANGILHHNSGKTFGFCRGIALRAQLAPGSRHAIFRFRFNHIKASIIADTWPKMMGLCFPGVDAHCKLDKTDWYYEFPNSSQVWFAGLDDKERVEKVLGQEYATLFFNECSQIPYASRVMAISRLAQAVEKKEGGQLRLKAYYDMNPVGMAHWTYKLFVEKRDPDRRTPLPNPENFAAIAMNPDHNKENLPAVYLDELSKMPEAARRRFFLGQFANMEDSQLWSMELLDQNRIMDGQIPQLIRIVVAVDPSGARGDEDMRSDEIGIIVVGLGIDGRAYVLEDLSGRMGPADWAAVAVAAYDRHKASQIVAETNYGGAMVAATIKAAANSPDRIAGATLAIPVIEVTASRGKVVRAEPIAALYEQKKVSHVGHFEDLEDQLQAFTTNGYIGTRSPDRGDALVWALTALFPALTRKDEVTAGYRAPPKVNLGHSKAKARLMSRRR